LGSLASDAWNMRLQAPEGSLASSSARPTAGFGLSFDFSTFRSATFSGTLS